MTLTERLNAKKTLGIIAVREGCSVKQVRKAIQECIDVAWNHAWTPGNLQAQVNWQLMFPGGKKPTVEEFVVAMARKITAEDNLLHRLN